MLHAHHEMCRFISRGGDDVDAGLFLSGYDPIPGLDVAVWPLSIVSPHGPMISEDGAKGSFPVLPHRAF